MIGCGDILMSLGMLLINNSVLAANWGTIKSPLCRCGDFLHPNVSSHSMTDLRRIRTKNKLIRWVHFLLVVQIEASERDLFKIKKFK